MTHRHRFRGPVPRVLAICHALVFFATAAAARNLTWNLNADGLFRVVADWRFQAVPPEVLAKVLEQVEMDTPGRP